MKKMLFIILALLSLLCMTYPAFGEFEEEISAKACMLVTSDGSVLYEKNPNEHMLIASTTKIMTALVVIENCKLDEKVTIKPEYADIEGSSIYLQPGEDITVLQLLYGLMLESGNDAAVALAEHTAGSVDNFARLMNEKAQELGCTDTSFKNPNGLDAEEHYSSASDLAKITACAMENHVFCDIVSTKSARVAGRELENHNKLLWQYEGTVGVKTGYTMSAGRILVSCVIKDGTKLICVTISDPDDWEDHKRLYDWAFSEYENIAMTKEEFKTQIPVISGTNASVTAMPEYERTFLVKNNSNLSFSYEMPKFVYAPVLKGDSAGQLVVTCDGIELERIALVYTQSVPLDYNMRLNRWQKIKRSFQLSEKYGGYPLIYYIF